MLLQFRITNQHIERCDHEHPVADSRGYLRAHFDFATDEWDGITKSVNFLRDDIAYTLIIGEDNTVTVPWEVLTEGEFRVSCFGGDLITNDCAVVKVFRSGYIQGETPSEPTPDVYATIINALAGINGIITTDGDGTKMLADNGTYKPIDNITTPLALSSSPTYLSNMEAGVYVTRTSGPLMNNPSSRAGFNVSSGSLIVVNSSNNAIIFNGNTVVKLGQTTTIQDITDRSCYYKTGADIVADNYESAGNKTDEINQSNRTSTTVYPSAKAVADLVENTTTKPWQLINDTTITNSTTNALAVSKDMANNPFAYDSITIIIEGNSPVARINVNSRYTLPEFSSCYLSDFMGENGDYTAMIEIGEDMGGVCRLTADYRPSEVIYTSNQAGVNNPHPFTALLARPQNKITYVNINQTISGNNNPFARGTRIRIYGRNTNGVQE